MPNAYPVFPINILICVPLSGQEGVLLANDLPVKEGDHLRVLVRQVLYLQIATQVRILLVNMLQQPNTGTVFISLIAGLNTGITIFIESVLFQAALP